MSERDSICASEEKLPHRPQGRLIDETGKRYGRLVVKERAANDAADRAAWLCQCDCGESRVVVGGQLRSGKTQSCGCYMKMRMSQSTRTHGHSKTSEYCIWRGIKKRCTLPNSPFYYRYGGRGITMCDRWLHSFEAFYEDMGPRPSTRHSIDRIDNNGNYEPSNCRWATSIEQRNNADDIVRLTVDGVTMTIREWSKRTGIPPKTIYNRLRLGWDHKRACTQPTQGTTNA